MSQPLAFSRQRLTSVPGAVRAIRRDMSNVKHSVYILRSDRDPARHYVGLTSDVAQRLEWHNAGQNVHTVRNRPWSVVVSLQCPTEDAARRFERYLKSGSGRAFAKRHFE